MLARSERVNILLVQLIQQVFNVRGGYLLLAAFPDRPLNAVGKGARFAVFARVLRDLRQLLNVKAFVFCQLLRKLTKMIRSRFQRVLCAHFHAAQRYGRVFHGAPVAQVRLCAAECAEHTAADRAARRVHTEARPPVGHGLCSRFLFA